MCAARTTPAFIPKGTQIPQSFNPSLQEFDNFVAALRTNLNNGLYDELKHFFQVNVTPFRPLLDQKGTLDGILEELIGKPQDLNACERAYQLTVLMKENLLSTRWATICQTICLFQIGNTLAGSQLVQLMIETDRSDETARKKYILMLKEHVTLYTSDGNDTMLKKIQHILSLYDDYAAQLPAPASIPLEYNKV